MGARRYSTERMIVEFWEVKIEMGRGVKVPNILLRRHTSSQTFYRWRKRYGELDRSEVRRLNALEQQSMHLQKVLAV